MGEMGLLPVDFYSMTWTDYNRAAQGYWLRDARYLQGVRKIVYANTMLHGDPKATRGKTELSMFITLADGKQKRKKATPKLNAKVFEDIKKRYKFK